MQELERVSGSLFFDISDELRIAQRVWHEISEDPTFIFKAREAKTDWLMPTWIDPLGNRSASYACKEYTVYSVDGSQIYPDRHQGTSCSLINVGRVTLAYGQQSSVHFQSIPYVFTSHDAQAYDNAVDWINCLRQEYEFNHGIELVAEHRKDTVHTHDGKNIPELLIFDGSLIFWHLESKNLQTHADFLATYLGSLYQLSQQQIFFASYISAPKSKELVNLIRLQLSNFDPINEAYKQVDHLVDAHIAAFFLQPTERTIVFQNHSPITQSYPESIKPYFFYLHNGYEIGRVEIPAWIAQDSKKVDQVAAIILDQCQKGYGYPVAIAEAHEQAVVKGPDREFFYQIVQRIGVLQKRSLQPSIKSMKKMRMGI